MKLKTKIILGVVLTPLLFPFPETIAPMGEITVVDKSNNPVAGARIHQTWQQYTLERTANYEDKITNNLGKVTFNKRTIWSNYLGRFFGGVGSFLSSGAHASFGPSSWILASHDCYYGSYYRSLGRNNILVLDKHMHAKNCAVIQGTATVIDGENLEIDGQRIRLDGVDALEDEQLCYDGSKEWECGKNTGNFLSDYIDHRPVKCVQRGLGINERTAAVCYVNDDELNALIVSNGLAVGERSRGVRFYASEEELAKENKSGIWGSEFVMPRKWRRENGLKQE